VQEKEDPSTGYSSNHVKKENEQIWLRGNCPLACKQLKATNLEDEKDRLEARCRRMSSRGASIGRRWPDSLLPVTMEPWNASSEVRI
jgi:hypothetical protein